MHLGHGGDAGTGGLLGLRDSGIHNLGELVLAPLVGDGAFLSGDSGDPLNVPGGEETLESGMSMKRYLGEPGWMFLTSTSTVVALTVLEM